jgi:hypothetical protein
MIIDDQNTHRRWPKSLSTHAALHHVDHCRVGVKRVSTAGLCVLDAIAVRFD